IAMVTSPTGAAIRDMLQVLTRRWPLADVIVIPVPVQGQGAGIRIAEGLDIATRIPGVDVIVTGRGGGSLEDLWCFNEEVVARAIVRTTVPVISAVGHEIDVSISDLVADFRALTPTEAIEHAVPDVADVQAELERIRQRALRALKQQAQQARYRLSALADRRPFSRPRELFSSLRQRLDEWDFRLGQLSRKLIEERRQELSKVSAQLDALSPLKTLQRGYGLIQDVETGQTIRSVSRLQPGQQIRTVLSDGTAHATVSSIEQSRNDSIK
ncbi:MAG: exodeoxyribonuclease VII large subunit, partial [Planctomycetaceae bacterium]|nr:exodeoxyribonuclease VII large subunit [Planctomycetaceae bacterium]